MRGRLPKVLTIRKPDKSELERIAHSDSLPWFQVRRARIVLGMASCPECFGTNLKIVNIRDVQKPRRKGESASERPVVARKIEVQCRRCKWSGFIVRPVK